MKPTHIADKNNIRLAKGYTSFPLIHGLGGTPIEALTALAICCNYSLSHWRARSLLGSYANDFIAEESLRSKPQGRGPRPKAPRLQAEARTQFRDIAR